MGVVGSLSLLVGGVTASVTGAAGEGSPPCWPGQILSSLLGSPGTPASHPISQPGGLIPSPVSGLYLPRAFASPPWFGVNFFCTLHSPPVPPPPLPLLYPLFVPMSHFTIKLITTCASAGRAPGLAAWGLPHGRGEEGGDAGRQPPECPGSVGWGAPKAGAPGGEQKPETGSVCGLHDNKGWGGLHS